MHELTNLAQYTSVSYLHFLFTKVNLNIKDANFFVLVQELYHEYHALGRFEQDYRRKIEEVEALHLPKKG